MRSWIAQLREANQLAYVRKPVDPRTEMGALLWQSREKALLFENLKGYPGWRVLGMAPANLQQAALAFETTLENLIPKAAQLFSRRLPVERVASGPVKEVIWRGKEVDLNKLPIHTSGSKDGGPYISGGLCITKDPDTGARNVSFHRLQLKAPNRTGIMSLPMHHTWMNFRKYEERGEPCPIAVFIGHHPMYYMGAATSGPYGMDELEVVGGLLGEPVRVVPCETVDLEVPADAEIVLEGYILPGVREPEGPFAEFQDYYLGGLGNNPVVEYQCVTMRHDAIFKAVQNGSEVEGCIYHKVPMSAEIFNRIKDISGYVDLKNVLVLPGIFGVVVQMTPRFYGEAKHVLLGVFSSSYPHPKVVIGVDEDVNIFNYWEILWAINTRVDPAKDIVIIPGTRQNPMDPNGEELFAPGDPRWQRIGSKVIIDATKPPTSDEKAREKFERIKPMGYGRVRLEDYIEFE